MPSLIPDSFLMPLRMRSPMRQPLLALVVAAAVALPATAQADVIGASAKYHGGFMKTSRDATWLTGAELALQVLGFEFFADLRFFENHFDGGEISSDWFWDRIGARFGLGLPFALGAEKSEVFLDAAYIANRRPVNLADPTDVTPHKPDKGLAAGGGLRFDYGLFGPIYFTLQPEVGFDLLFSGPPETEIKPHLSFLAAIKLDI